MTAPAVTWHDVENGAYEADLPLWRELAADADGPILDLGAGTGRVAVDLAAKGHTVVALDTDPELLAALATRAASVRTVEADARSFALDERFGLILAPMQLLQIIGGRDGRLALLTRVHEHLAPGGSFAAALADPHQALPRDGASPPLPDMLERDGWVFSSQPVSVREDGEVVVVERRRQAVSPAGELREDGVLIELELVSADQLEHEARAVGLEPVARHTIPETDDHIGSTVIVCRR